MTQTSLEMLYKLLTRGSIEGAIEEFQLKSNPALAANLRESPDALSGFQDWVELNGYSPLQLEEVEPDAKPRFGNDHLILQRSGDEWHLIMQERGRYCHLIRTSGTRSEALRSAAEEDWNFLLMALERVRKNSA